MRIPTVKIHIDHGRGWCIINKCDFRPSEHRLFNESAPASMNVVIGAGDATTTATALSNLTDDELRAAISAMGRTAHPKCKRETLIAKYEALRASGD